MKHGNIKDESDDLIAMRIDTLKTIIPELIEKRERRASLRLIIVCVGLFLISAYVTIFGLKLDIWFGLFAALIITGINLFITAVLNAICFGRNSHDALIIEKLKTEYFTLTGTRNQEDYDMTLEVSKIKFEKF
jgi:hypothetical protein